MKPDLHSTRGAPMDTAKLHDQLESIVCAVQAIEGRLQRLRKAIVEVTPTVPVYKTVREYRVFREHVVMQLRERGLKFAEIAKIIGRSDSYTHRIFVEGERHQRVAEHQKRKLAAIEKIKAHEGSFDDWSLYDMGLTARTMNALSTAKVETVGELRTRSAAELLRGKHMGRKSLREVREALSRLGVVLKDDAAWAAEKLPCPE